MSSPNHENKDGTQHADRARADVNFRIGAIALIILGIPFVMRKYAPLSVYADAVEPIAWSLGVAFLIAAVAEGRLVRWAAEKIQHEVTGLLAINADQLKRKILQHLGEQTNTLSNEISSTLRDASTIIDGAEEGGIINIISSRKHSGQEFRDAVCDLINHGSSLCAIGVSLGILFNQDENQVWEALRQRFAQSGDGFQVRVFLMDPWRHVARLRVAVEEDDEFHLDQIRVPAETTRSLVHRDVREALRSIRSLRAGVERDIKDDGKVGAKREITAKFYNFCQPGLLVANENSLLFEPYHFGREDPGDLSHFPQARYTTGGRVPVLRAHSESDLYKRMKAHFEFFWRGQSEDPYFNSLVSTEEEIAAKYEALDEQVRSASINLAHIVNVKNTGTDADKSG